MADKHVTDEEIWQASGHKPRMPAGIPKATCLNCGLEHDAFYCSQAHDCRIDMSERKLYIDWLEDFRKYGLGVLKSWEDAKFPADQPITGRTALTFHLQSDLHLDTQYVLDNEYYQGDIAA